MSQLVKNQSREPSMQQKHLSGGAAQSSDGIQFDNQKIMQEMSRRASVNKQRHSDLMYRGGSRNVTKKPSFNQMSQNYHSFNVK